MGDLQRQRIRLQAPTPPPHLPLRHRLLLRPSAAAAEDSYPPPPPPLRRHSVMQGAAPPLPPRPPRPYDAGAELRRRLCLLSLRDPATQRPSSGSATGRGDASASSATTTRRRRGRAPAPPQGTAPPLPPRPPRPSNAEAELRLSSRARRRLCFLGIRDPTMQRPSFGAAAGHGAASASSASATQPTLPPPPPRPPRPGQIKFKFEILTEQKLTKAQEEEIIRRTQASEKNDTSELRKISRQVYLQKRRDQKLLEIRDDIIDHEYIFKGVKLTEAEESEFRYKRKIYELAKEHLEDVDNINEYKMPDAYDMEGRVNQEKRFAAAVQRYRLHQGMWSLFSMSIC